MSKASIKVVGQQWKHTEKESKQGRLGQCPFLIPSKGKRILTKGLEAVGKLFPWWTCSHHTLLSFPLFHKYLSAYYELCTLKIENKVVSRQAWLWLSGN